MNLVKKAPPFLSLLPCFTIGEECIDIIESTAEFREVLFEKIASAKKRIYLTALYLQDDASGQQVLEALYQAKQKNPQLDIKVFVDFSRAQRGLMGHAESVGNVRLYREYANKYEHQVEILGVPVKSKEMLGVLHIKGFVFDDTLLYSGASINDIYLQQNDRYRYDRYHIIQSRELCDSFVNYLQDYLVSASAVKSLNEDSIIEKKLLKIPIRNLKKSLRASHYTFSNQCQPSEEKPIAITPLIGFGGRRNPLNATIYNMVKYTDEKVTIFTPYFNIPGKVYKAIRRILKKGKTVNIVVGDKVANDFYIPQDQPFNKVGIVPYVYEANLRKFIKRNQRFIDQKILNVYLWQDGGNSFHLKGMSCDDKAHLITGHNINPRAWSLDLENGVLIQDPQKKLKEKFDSEYRQILTHTTRVENVEQIETINDYPEAPRKLMKNVRRAKLDSILNRLL